MRESGSFLSLIGDALCSAGCDGVMILIISVDSPPYPCIHTSACSPIHSSIHASTHSSMHQSIDPSIHPSTHLFFYPPTYPCVYPSMYPCIHPPTYPSIHHSFNHSLIHLARVYGVPRTSVALWDSQFSAHLTESLLYACCATCWFVEGNMPGPSKEFTVWLWVGDRKVNTC